MTFIIICGVAILFVVLSSIIDNKNTERIRKLENDLKGNYGYYGGNLNLYKTDSRMSDLFQIVPYTASTYNNVPEKYVYTGATVGGVTTGGVHKTGGYTETISHSTKRYELKIKEYDFDTKKIKCFR